VGRREDGVGTPDDAAGLPPHISHLTFSCGISQMARPYSLVFLEALVGAIAEDVAYLCWVAAIGDR